MTSYTLQLTQGIGGYMRPKKLHELLADASRWTQRALARDEAGHPVQPTDPEAVSWCLLGAALKCYGEDADRGKIYKALLGALSSQEGIPYWNLEQLLAWNDHPTCTYAKVRALVAGLDI